MLTVTLRRRAPTGQRPPRGGSGRRPAAWRASAGAGGRRGLRVLRVRPAGTPQRTRAREGRGTHRPLRPNVRPHAGRSVAARLRSRGRSMASKTRIGESRMMRVFACRAGPGGARRVTCDSSVSAAALADGRSSNRRRCVGRSAAQRSWNWVPSSKLMLSTSWLIPMATAFASAPARTPGTHCGVAPTNAHSGRSAFT
jgi:hypothetical protein